MRHHTALAQVKRGSTLDNLMQSVKVRLQWLDLCRIHLGDLALAIAAHKCGGGTAATHVREGCWIMVLTNAI